MNTLPTEIFRRLCQGVAVFALWAGVLHPAQAHDFWIEPLAFHPPAGERVGLWLYVGQDFSGVSVPYQPDRFVRYEATGPGGVQTVAGVLGDEPAGTFLPATPGRYVVALHTRPESVEFENRAEFERYLHKEGLERHLPAAARQPADHKVLESYFRCAKSLVTAGTTDAQPMDRALGLPLELVAIRLSRTGPQPADLDLQLLYEGKPLQGALVILSNKAAPRNKLKARTGADGHVQFKLARRGVWLATAVHMRPAAWLAREDWNSLWASLTFELR